MSNILFLLTGSALIILISIGVFIFFNWLNSYEEDDWNVKF